MSRGIWEAVGRWIQTSLNKYFGYQVSKCVNGVLIYGWWNAFLFLTSHMFFSFSIKQTNNLSLVKKRSKGLQKSRFRVLPIKHCNQRKFVYSCIYFNDDIVGVNPYNYRL